MGTAEKIRTCRVRAGKSAQQVASDLGLNDAWYSDLETYDDELASTLTLFQAHQLASLLGVGLPDLLVEDVQSAEKIGLLDVPSKIKAHISAEDLSIEDLEELVGWELKQFLESPVASAAEMPVSFLRDLSNHLGVSLLSLLIEEHAH
jgi:transcriptional regulator with XRE-family HTH domain